MAPVPAPPLTVRPASVPSHASDIIRKMEEMKSKTEEEQRLKRERRIHERSVRK